MTLQENVEEEKKRLGMQSHIAYSRQFGSKTNSLVFEDEAFNITCGKPQVMDGGSGKEPFGHT